MKFPARHRMHPRYRKAGFLRSLSRWVWKEQIAARHHGLRLQEETLTEMLLLQIARESEDLGLRVKMFNRHQEGGRKDLGIVGNGADWEWFVKTDFCQISFRVQAKVLSSGVTSKRKLTRVGKYEGLHDDRKQTQELIDAANRRKSNPIYVFYNHPWVTDHALFSAPSHSYYVRSGDFGCAVATAQFVKQTKGNLLSNLIPGMVPWHLFFAWGRHDCNVRGMMSRMPGEQEFFPESPEPDWLEFAQEGDERMDGFLLEHRLQGVAYFDFTDPEGFDVPR